MSSGGAPGDWYDTQYDTYTDKFADGDGTRLLASSGISAGGKGAGGGGGGRMERLSDYLAVRWKVVVLAWLAVAVVGIASFPGFLSSSSLPADPRAVPQSYQLHLSLPAYGAFTTPTPASGTAPSPPPPTFSAVASLQLLVTGAPTSCLVLHAANLNISRLDVEQLGSSGSSGRENEGTAAGGRRRLQQQPPPPPPPAALLSRCLCGCNDSSPACSVATIQSATSQSIVLNLNGLVLATGDQWRLTLTYTGSVRPSSDGFGLFMSDPWVADTPVGAAPSNSVLLTTQFEDNFARYLLPCFDAPGYKANFSVAVELPDNLTVLSNTPPLSSVPVTTTATTTTTTGGRKLVTFAVSQGFAHVPLSVLRPPAVGRTTPVMPVYALAIAAGNMTSLNSNITTFPMATSSPPPEHLSPQPPNPRMYSGGSSSSSSMQIRVWGPASMNATRRLAGSLGIAEAAYSFYLNYTGMALPLSKLDLVAVPGKSYAMENWGLLMFDTESCPSCGTCAPNYLVMPQDNLALNEGVASYIEYDCIAAVLPSVLPLSSYGLSLAEPLRRLVVPPLGMAAGVHEGVLWRSRWADEDPLVGAPLDANASSVLVYSKAAAILDAAAGLAGQEGLRRALQGLLASNMYGTATVSDLVDRIAAEAAGQWNGTLLGDQEAVAAGVMGWFTKPGVADSDERPSALPAAAVQLGSVARGERADAANYTPVLRCPGNPSGPGSGTTGIPANLTTTTATWWLPLLAVSADGSSPPTGPSGGPAVPPLLLFPLPYGLPSDKWMLRGPGFTGMYVTAYGSPVGVNGTVLDAQMVLRDTLALAFSLPATTSTTNPTAAGAPLGDPSALLLLPSGSVPGVAAAGNTAPLPAVLAAIDTALTSPLARTGAGMYSLGQPALMALDYLQGLFASSSNSSASCNADLQRWVVRRVGPLARAATNNTAKPDNLVDQFLLRLAQSQIVTEAALWGDSGARDFACSLAAQIYAATPSSAAEGGTGAVDPDWLPAALAVPLGAAFNASLTQLMSPTADPEVVAARLYALSYTGDAVLRSSLLDVLQAGLNLSGSVGTGRGGAGARVLSRSLVEGVMGRLVGSAQRDVFFKAAASGGGGDLGGSGSGTNSTIHQTSQPPFNELLSAALTGTPAAGSGGLMGLISTLAGNDGGRALGVLESTVARFLTSPEQLSNLSDLLCGRGPASAFYTTGVAAADLATARSRILGRAQSRLQWIASTPFTVDPCMYAVMSRAGWEAGRLSLPNGRFRTCCDQQSLNLIGVGGLWGDGWPVHTATSIRSRPCVTALKQLKKYDLGFDR
ncbi:hypothetical protein VOLCADRAFT_98977 [Volvox carteri f. nagariensis]|uniref:Aminopeptidase N-like N-terminal domain-containing protein n=1 Tax=Volvox carteri f. nagariensis TaxID=3068 RepID=D8UGR2_VOLCA|nr:uncharacterized protein VOLCADRAFT_98977 [Volvox carteri f. nagariensis]EFJ41093.1 hypothetical protein VOLCADRAFT_98977 [Volvox carteri f. nagariensis]|eukprot:XP_002957856.1 hypothetical protein VOLCADRAFT_98977 [Volvox carteri f. nagariensis]